MPAARSGWTCRARRLPGVQRRRRAAVTTAVHLPRRRHRRRTAAARQERVDRRPGRDADLDRRPRAPRRLYDDLYARASSTANRKTVHLFSSIAHYYEPAGPVSWDVTMSDTPPDWRVRCTRATSSRSPRPTTRSTARGTRAWGSWSVWTTAPAGGIDPFTTNVDVPGHPHPRPPARERQPRRRATATCPTTRRSCPTRPCRRGTVDDQQLRVRPGRHELATRGPADDQAGPVAHVQQPRRDAGNGIWHTITAARRRATATTGIAFPLANGRRSQLRLGRARLRPAAHRRRARDTWSTPTNLPPGTYTYFCRIHPFMRGGFRIVSG